MYWGLFLDFSCRSTWSGYLWTVSYCLSLGGFTKLAFISVLLGPAPSPQPHPGSYFICNRFSEKQLMFHTGHLLKYTLKNFQCIPRFAPTTTVCSRTFCTSKSHPVPISNQSPLPNPHPPQPEATIQLLAGPLRGLPIGGLS